jgi:hypothetical protein
MKRADIDMFMALIKSNLEKKRDCVISFDDEAILLKTGTIANCRMKELCDSLAISATDKPIPKNMMQSKQIVKEG